MITWLIQQCRLLYKFITSNDSPRQMAMAAAFGVLIGLVPKGNLLAVGITTIFLGMRVHMATGMVVGLLATFLAAALDPAFSRIGEAILTSPGLQASLASAYQLPFAPWTAFNNTIVCGSAVVGLVAFYPTYRLSLPAFERWRRAREQAREENAASDEGEGAAVEHPQVRPSPEITVSEMAKNATAVTEAVLQPARAGQLRVDPSHASPSAASLSASRATAKVSERMEETVDSSVPKPHFASRKSTELRESLQRYRFQRFVDELESISKRRAA